MDKKGKANWIAILLIVGAVYFLYTSGALNGLLGGTSTSTTQNIITTNPTISFAGVDAQQAGTTVGNSYYAHVQDGAEGFGAANSPTTAVPGQVITFLLQNATTYHNVKLDAITIAATSFPKTVKFNKNATITENIYTTTGLVIANGLGVQNQTDLGNGASYNLKDEMTANALTETQDMVCIIEITAGTNASTSPVGATFGGQQPSSMSKPTWYSTAGTGSNVYLFDVSSIKNSQTVTNNILLTAKSTGRFQAASYMKKSCYTKEYFIDPTSGTIAYDVADSQGTVKSMATYTYTVYFQ